MDEEEKENVDIAESAANLKRFYDKLEIKDIVIIGLALMLFLMYIIHTQEIDKCVIFFNNIIRENAEPARLITGFTC